jgi:hypothetical protein
MSDAPSAAVPPTVRKKVVGRPFQKGVSGNPGGRYANGGGSTTAAQRLARELRAGIQADLVRLLWGIAANEAEETRERISAAKALLDEPAPEVEELLQRIEDLERELDVEAGRVASAAPAEPSPEAS